MTCSLGSVSRALCSQFFDLLCRVLGMANRLVVVTSLAIAAGTYLLFRREFGITDRKRNKADVIAKYVLAVFLATYLSIAFATLLALPVLFYGRLAHNLNAEGIFSVAVDRPYFPLQSAVAFAVGFAVAVRFRQWKLLWVWVWPAAQVVISIVLHKPESVMQGFLKDVWHTYFNWYCGCSATLLQWQVMSVMYAAIAFTLGALTRYFLSKEIPKAHASQIEARRS